MEIPTSNSTKVETMIGIDKKGDEELEI